MFAEMARCHRRRVGMTQEELAARSGLSVRSIRKLESGRTRTPRPVTVRLLADALGLSGADRDRFGQAAAGEATGPAAGADPATPPRQLPVPPHVYTGRRRELAVLDEIGDDATATVTVIDGMGGIGKTALALQWAHSRMDAFPEGQLYLDLRGYSTGQPVSPAEALPILLRSMGVKPERVPVDEAEASALYRSLLAGRRVLVLLDNAYGAEQIRPLLPGGPGCLALVTSRERLTGLVARDGARRISLDVLPAAEASALLTALLGTDRSGADMEAVNRLARACAYLPLALRVAAANLLDHPHRSVGDLVSELSSRDRLSALEVPGDPQAAVRATLDRSYHAIPHPARRLFRLLGSAPGTDFSGEAAAALADLPPEETRALLDRLVSAHLLDEDAAGRYRFHDLLRDYARHVAGADAPAAAERLLHWYLHHAEAASRVLYPTVARLPREPAAPAPDGATAGLDRAGALAWLDAERGNLVASARHAADHGPPRVAWRLADALRLYLWSGRHGGDGLAVGDAGVRAAVSAGHLAGEAAAELCLALACEGRADYGQAHRHGLRALTLADQGRWRDGAAAATNFAASTSQRLGNLDEAVDYHRRALAINRDLGRRGAQGVNLANLGVTLYARGDLRESLRSHEEALAISREVRDRLLEATELSNLGAAHDIMGDLDAASGYLDAALRIAAETGDPHLESLAVSNLASVHTHAGRHDAALAHASRSLEQARSHGDAVAESYANSELAKVHSALGEHEQAIARYREARRLVPDDTPLNHAEMLLGIADARLRLAQPTEALTHVEAALRLARASGYRLREAQALTLLAEIKLHLGEHDAAARSARRALSIHREIGQAPGEARALAICASVESTR